MKDFTKAIHTKVDTSNDAPAVTPIYQASAFEAHSDFFYTRKNNPNIQELEDTVANLAKTKYSLAVTTGMTSISLVLSLLKPGQSLCINSFLYGCSYKLFQHFANQYNIQLEITNLSLEENWEKACSCDMIFFETPTNPFLYSIKIKELANKYKGIHPKGILVVDNTWATPLYQKPCELGADISLHSATKYFSGHSDVMGGLINTNDDHLYEKLLSLRFYFGAILAPQSAWLLKRSILTLEIRLEKHHKTTLLLKEFLENREEVSQVFYPEIDGEQLTSYATLVFFELDEKYKNGYTTFSQALDLFSTGTGMACVTSMVAQPYNGSHASMCDEEKQEMNLTESIVRLSFGLEDPEDLMTDLDQAFNKLH